ncbi:TlpA family protein disulfide reductase [Polaribacter haliotis]|uniref:TlpA family protein disulfide reductase n=1 Tax=Polaribacter haliotis TaxID=1888915 RepID=A0A7L8AID4_9FLAO|nr:TlpA disulfide reductase family protein [Polaribacter haliotis]QOD61760.1 TlpA family protein disulfide reductase [Polaribacter haliotis]
MDKKSFWKGFAVGGVLLIATLTILYFKVFVQPDVSLQQVEVEKLDGTKTELAQYLGKPLVVNYWATWCRPCIKEFPYFEKVKQELGDDVNFIMISDESLEKINNFKTNNPYTFNFLRSKKSLGDYDIILRPTTYFYDAKGNLITKHTASLDVAKIKELIGKIK